MSGGSHNYLYVQDDLCAGDLEAMAARLDELGATAAAAMTRALVPPALPYPHPLRDLWHAVEWRDSGDYGNDQLAAALEAFR